MAADLPERAWPPPSTEERIWRGAAYGSRRARQTGRFLATIPPLIARADLVLPARLAGELEAALRAVEALNHHPASEHLDAISSPLLRSESVASSRIENLRVSHRRVAEAREDPAHARAAAVEVAGNVAAMEAAVTIGSAPGALSVNDILEIHTRLLEGTRDEPFAGRIRAEQNWIGGPAPTHALYVPPPHERVAELLDDLVGYANRTDVPVVAHAAVVHAQFEAIHPFVDGNGRTGRCLVHTIFRKRGVSPRLVPPISPVLLSDRDRYFASLAAYQRDGDVLTWLEEFSTATRLASQRAQGLVERVDELSADWLARAGTPRSGSITRRAIDVLIRHPVVSARTLAEATNTDPNVARRALNALEASGVLIQISKGQRHRVWAADEVFDLLDEFEHGLARGHGPTRHLR